VHEVKNFLQDLLRSQNARFILRNEFVADTAPANAAREQRHNKVHKIQIRNENANGDVNP